MKFCKRIFALLFSIMSLTYTSNQVFCATINKSLHNSSMASKSTTKSKPSVPSKNLKLIQFTKLSFNKAINQLSIELSGNHSTLKHGYYGNNKIVIDLYDCSSKIGTKEYPGNGLNIKKVRTSQFSTKPSITRIVVDLGLKIKYKVTDKKNRLLVDFYDKRNPLLSSVSRGQGLLQLNQGTVSGVTYNQEVAKLSGKIIVLDPGHGATDTGACGNGIMEKGLNLDISLRVKALLEGKNITVHMTRSSDNTIDNLKASTINELKSRAQFANNTKPDFFVSVHTNYADATSASGIETLYYPDNGDYKKNLSKGKLSSTQLAQAIQHELVKATGAVDRGIVSRPNLAVLKYTNVIPALVEVGFLSNPSEAKKLNDEIYKQKIATGIANGIEIALLNN